MGLGLQQDYPGNGCWLLFQFKAYLLAEFSHLLETVSYGLFKLPTYGVRPTHIRENHVLYCQSTDINDNTAQKNTFT